MQESSGGHSGNTPDESTQSPQRPAGEEALEGNTGVGGRSVDQGGDSDGNTGVMSNDEFENEQENAESSGSQDASGTRGS